ASDLLRTKQTAQIVADALNLKVSFDTRLREVGFGDLNGKPAEELLYLGFEKERLGKGLHSSETYEGVLNRVWEFFQEINAKYKKPWSFLDGPITANNPMGVHHAWGRTYKDLLQRYFAMKGFDERYQNGFDCQGLWVEVEVEKELGFKNKKTLKLMASISLLK